LTLIERTFSHSKLITFFIVALWAVVNNAGISKGGLMEWMDKDNAKKTFEVNAIGPLTVTNAFLPLLRISHGRVIIVSSLAGMHIKTSHRIF
jgi:NAD(P)-dependent dehydrogenase (short-subunit alcohol dehydrogenase family)